MTVTVRAALGFSAHSTQLYDDPQSEKDAVRIFVSSAVVPRLFPMRLTPIRYVEQIIELLDFQDLADAMIGVPGFSLGKHANALRSESSWWRSDNCHEPTSGFDGQGAFNVVRFVRKLAAARQAILYMIHQPNSMLFKHFGKFFSVELGVYLIYHVSCP